MEVRTTNIVSRPGVIVSTPAATAKARAAASTAEL
jgi:hypothetical protein